MKSKVALVRAQPTGLLREIFVSLRRAVWHLKEADETNDPHNWFQAQQALSCAKMRLRQLTQERLRCQKL